MKEKKPERKAGETPNIPWTVSLLKEVKKPTSVIPEKDTLIKALSAFNRRYRSRQREEK